METGSDSVAGAGLAAVLAGPAVSLPGVGLRLPLRLGASGAAPPQTVSLRLLWRQADHGPIAAETLCESAVAPGEDGAWLLEAAVPPCRLAPGAWRLEVVAETAEGRELGRLSLAAQLHGFETLPVATDLVPAQLRRFELAELPPKSSARDGDGRVVMCEPVPQARTPVEQLDLHRMAVAGGRAKRFSVPYEIPGLEMAVLSDGVLFGNIGVVATPALGVLDESWNARNQKVPRTYPLGHFSRRGGRPRDVDVAAVTWIRGFNGNKWNYFHVHAEHLCALLQIEMFMRGSGLPVPAVLVPAYTPFLTEMIELLDAAPGRVTTVGGDPIRARQLLFPSALVMLPNTVHPLMVDAMRRIRGNAFRRRIAPVERSNGIIYVSRLDAAARRMRNEDRLIAALEARGVEIFVSSGKSYAEQVLSFSEARIVIGPHGAGLTNIGFAPAGALVVEIFNHSFVMPHFARMAALLGHRYRCFTQPPTRSDPADPQAWDLDLDAFLAFLDPVLEESPLRG